MWCYCLAVLEQEVGDSGLIKVLQIDYIMWNQRLTVYHCSLKVIWHKVLGTVGEHQHQEDILPWFLPSPPLKDKGTCSGAARGLQTVVCAGQPCSGCLTGPRRRCVSSQVGGWRCGHAGGTGRHSPGHFQQRWGENLEGRAPEIPHPAKQDKDRSASITRTHVTQWHGGRYAPVSLVLKAHQHNLQAQKTPPSVARLGCTHLAAVPSLTVSF